MINKILENFKQIASIPRCSHHEGKILEFFKKWAKEKLFYYKTDKAGNIVIYVSGSKGREEDEIIVLQGHMDMVCVKDTNSNHNFETDSIEIIEKNGIITANKTTLGADNGIGLAIAMYLAEIESHPPLEILITSSEEVGLIGALNLDASMIKGKKLINIDTEDLGEICVSSAGGVRIDILKKFDTQNKNKKAYKIFLGGMKGGHSGVEIDKNRGNAIFSFLEFLDKNDIQLIEMKAGVADNAIPKELNAIVFSDKNIEKELDLLIKNIKENYDAKDVFYKIEHIDFSGKVVDKNEIKKMIKSMLNTNIGVIKMSDKIENLVRTSNNLGMFNFKNGELKIVYMPRSNSKDDLEEIKEVIKTNFKGFDINFSSEYPGWEENPNSEFIQGIKKKYDEVMKEKNLNQSEIVAYHAGLECGALVKKLGEDAQVVSIGPTIKGAHTTEENCDLKSVEIIGEILVDYLN